VTVDTQPGARRSGNSADVFVDVSGPADVTDYSSGLNILQHDGV
jgi:hypothetical protein